jgi:uncharacterized protein YjgD (DUF1641 family)
MGAKATFFSVLKGRVDREAGIVHGVAVITEGPALGHGMFVDTTTLAQVMEQAKTYTGGLKVTPDHTASASEIVGYLTGFRVEGTPVRADLHLLRSSPRREYILELAETIPDTFGLSIAFSGTDEKIGENWFARCAEIYSADIVSEPAANPSGLFQAGEITQPTSSDMTPEEIQAAIAAAIAPLVEKIAALEAAVVVDATTDITEMTDAQKAQVQSAAKEAALSVLREFNAALPAPVKFSAPAVEPKAESFESIVRGLKAAGTKHNDAVRKTQVEKPELYATYLSRAQKGEVILF